MGPIKFLISLDTKPVGRAKLGYNVVNWCTVQYILTIHVTNSITGRSNKLGLLSLFN